MPVTADTYLPFDAGAGANVAEAGWRSMARHWRPSGPLITGLAPDDWGVLRPSAGSGRQVLVAPGELLINGHYAKWDEELALDVTANSSGSTRVDAIVARLDAVGNDIEIDVKEGTPGAGAPALTDDSSTFELLLGTSSLLTGGTSVNVSDRRRCVGYSDTTYTPTFRFGNTAATVENPTASVIRSDGLVHVRFYGQITNLNGGSGSFSVSLPTASRVLLQTLGHPSIIGGVSAYSAMAVKKHALAVSYDNLTGYVYAVTGSSTGTAGDVAWTHADVPAGWSIRMDFTYQAAN